MKFRVALLALLLVATADGRIPHGGAIASAPPPPTSGTVISFAFVPPSQNTDNSSIAAGRVTGYELGVRSGGSAGTYPIVAEIELPATASLLSTALIPGLASGTYFAAVRAIGPNNSAWSSEISFTLN